ncbi:MAG: DUF4184 family protein [Fibrobacterota bacterium]|nr:DUF4184 family protein [Fibrobacterota bacterium]QQS05252.1 MAG: DUF4184 family protein [Fibrobacterota bacterium]
MPFTLSHPALVIPLLGRIKARGWKTSLFLGAMSPDFWVLGPGVLDRALTHGRWGFLLCPPMAVGFAWIFHVGFLPQILRLPGLPPYDLRSAFHWRWSLIGAFIGTATHILWDQLTHEGSRLQAYHPVFDKVLFVVRNDAITVGQLAWLGSSFIGGAILIGWLLWSHRKSGRRFVVFLDWQWAVILAAFCAPSFLYLAWLDDPGLSGQGGAIRIFGQVSAVRSLVLVSTLTTALAAWFCGWKTRRRPSLEDD